MRTLIEESLFWGFDNGASFFFSQKKERVHG